VGDRAQEIDIDFLMEDFPRMLTSMQIGAERIRNIVLSLRNFSRLDEAEMKIVDLHEGLESTLLILNYRLKPKSVSDPAQNIQLVKEYGSLPLVECYPSQLNQVFMNLLSNAIDALEEQIVAREKVLQGSGSSSLDRPLQPTITIRTQLCDRPDEDDDLYQAGRMGDRHNSEVVRDLESDRPQYLSICIADNGPGVPEKLQAKLFDPFFTTKPVGKGTGLGLSISQQIICERHRGTLRCISQPGKGTEFHITIPVRQREITKQ
jgi:Signal transduction histidine kinase